jgi:hypothetical protein
MKESPHFTGGGLFDQLAAWLSKEHPPELTIHITGYYVPLAGGLVAYYETGTRL